MDLSTNTPTSWLWDFGDGSPTGIEQNPYHTYTGVGTYTVELTATNDAGSDTETKPDYIEVPADTPTASFWTSKTSGYTPLSVNFVDTSTSLSPIVSWYWTFGDGNTSTVQNPSHVYYYPGYYTVALTVTNIWGKSDTETKMRHIAVAKAVPSLCTYDIAPPQTEEILAHMINTGDASMNVQGRGVRCTIPQTTTSPANSGFRRPGGPSLIFD